MPGKLPDGMRDELSVGWSVTQIPERDAVFQVAGQNLVCTLASEHNFDFLFGKMRNVKESNARRPHYRLIFLPNHLRQAGKEILGAKNYFVVFRPDMLRNLSRIGQLAVLVFSISHRKCLD